MITCATCGRSNEAHFTGTKDELLYVRVIDTSQNKKMFFCTDSCYLDKEFIQAVMDRTGNPWHPMTLEQCRRECGQAFSVMKDEYDQIVMEANKSYGLQQYRKRNGMYLPFADKAAGSATEPIEKINWADEAENSVLVLN